MNKDLTYITEYYGVPAKINGIVLFKKEKYGTIVGSQNAHLMITMNGEKSPRPYHPTWELEYL